ncbi:MAG: ATP-binding cassette domain-containing protein [Candidatus Hodarchaeales archaeon]
MSSQTILDVNDLTKVYGRELRLGGKTIGRRVTGAKDVSFTISKGEIFGFLGPNGAGKTTTMRAIMDYLHVKTGKVTFFGKYDHHKDYLDIRKQISYVPGDVSLYQNMTGYELIAYFNKFRPVDVDFVEEMKSQFRVDLSLKVGQLSKGNRQQVALIVSLASKPDLVIMDEPTSGLDPLMTANFHKIIKKLASEGMTFFLSSHDLAEVQSVCDRVGVIKEGRMIVIEHIENLKLEFMQNIKVKFSESKVPSEEDIKALKSVISYEKVKDRIYKLKMKENINELIRMLANYDVERLTIEEATLEDIFLQYYE